MATIVHLGRLDNREIAKQIKNWFDQKGFETKAIEQDGSYTVKARKSSGFRAMVGADRAIEIGIRTSGDETQLDVRQGSWKTNAISNAAWLVVTGGMNLVISGWSIVIQKDLENHIRNILNDMSGAKEVELSINEPKVVEPQPEGQSQANPKNKASGVNNNLSNEPPRNSNNITLNTIRIKCSKCGAIANGYLMHLKHDVKCQNCHEICSFYEVIKRPHCAEELEGKECMQKVGE